MSASLASVNPDNDLSGNEPIQHSSEVQQFSFTATGGEYFRIWIVNLLLTIITLGIYSAWAKVRRTSYFYDNTHLAGSSFEYHGNPIAILKGRIVAVIIFGGYNLAFKVSPIAGFIMLVILMAIFPWLMWKSLQFKLYNSSYRGIRFGFRGSLGKIYFNYIVRPFLTFLTLYLLAPFTHQRMKKFQHEESRFGTTYFSFDASVGSFYRIYLIGLAVMLSGIVVIGVGFAGTLGMLVKMGGMKHMTPQVAGSFFLFILAMYAWFFMMLPLFLTLTQNLIWSRTSLAGHQFQCKMKWGRVIFIMLTNIIGTIVTLGLFIPFAKVRMMKYRLESMSLVTSGDIDNFIAHEAENASSVGEGMADIVDFDISF